MTGKIKLDNTNKNILIDLRQTICHVFLSRIAFSNVLLSKNTFGESQMKIRGNSMRKIMEGKSKAPMGEMPTSILFIHTI